ncbi:hypothetical protein Droror1_Dr00013911 [Drosera rotundifolia]
MFNLAVLLSSVVFWYFSFYRSVPPSSVGSLYFFRFLPKVVEIFSNLSELCLDCLEKPVFPSRTIAWVPRSDGTFVVTRAPGYLYSYKKGGLIGVWKKSCGTINGIAFSNDGIYMVAVGDDGYLQVYEYATKKLVSESHGHYAALLCCAWSVDGDYILAGGKDKRVYVWSMEEGKMVACGEGHGSWVLGVSFDPFWIPPSSDDAKQDVTYWFGSVDEGGHLLLWNFSKHDTVISQQRLSQSSEPQRPDHIPTLHPLVTCGAHDVDAPLLGLVFTRELVLTARDNGYVRMWKRPCDASIV